VKPRKPPQFTPTPEKLSALEVERRGTEVVIVCPDEELAEAIHAYISNNLAPHKET
jgi:hypothetical protein